MNLADTQELFWSIIAERKPVERAHLDAVFVGAERLEIYAGMYVHRLVDALRAEFPRLAARLGDEAFFSLAEAYIRAHPSVHPSVAHVGRELPRYLRRKRQRELAELALLERTRSLVFDARDETPVGPDVLAGFSAEQLPRLRFAPIAGFAQLGRVVVFRREYVVHDVTVSELEAEAVALMRRRRSLGAICEVFAHEPAPASAAFAVVGGWLASGWIAACKVGRS